MKKFFNKVQNKANELAIRAKTTLDNAKAEGYIDTGVKIIIGVVVDVLRRLAERGVDRKILDRLNKRNAEKTNCAVIEIA